MNRAWCDMLRKTFFIAMVLAVSQTLVGCNYLRTHTPKQILSGDLIDDSNRFVEKVCEDCSDNPEASTNFKASVPGRAPVVVCRSQQCAPAKLSMTKEYIHNSLLQLLDNNNYSTALVCKASDTAHTCLENYIALPVKVGIVPTYAYIDSVKITDVILGKKNDSMKLILNYNLTYGGQVASCTPSQSILFIRDIDHILLEDSQYTCNMTTIGSSSVKTVFVVDYIDLDYGYIGGYYSIGISGPAYGGGNGYMILRLAKNAYPLAPALQAPKNAAKSSASAAAGISSSVNSGTQAKGANASVQVFPINKK